MDKKAGQQLHHHTNAKAEMKKSMESLALTESISLLQAKQAQELILLRDQFHHTYESLKPINLIRHTLKEASSSIEIKEGILNSAIGLTTGYFTKAILIGSSTNPVRKVLGTLLQFAVASVVSRNSEGIKSIGKVIIDKMFKNPVEVAQKFSENESEMIFNTKN